MNLLNTVKKPIKNGNKEEVMRRLVRDKRILTVNELTVVTERINNDINGNGRYQVDIFNGEW